MDIERTLGHLLMLCALILMYIMLCQLTLDKQTGIHSITREEAIIRFDLRDPLTAQSCVCKEAGSGAENKANHTATSQTTTSQTTTSKSVKEKPVDIISKRIAQIPHRRPPPVRVIHRDVQHPPKITNHPKYAAFLPQKEITDRPVEPAAFVEGLPRNVLLLSYQRSGSSFLADWLFANRTGVFFLYEPLDALYSSMFGVNPGWAVPADITTHFNGSLRIPPDDERESVTSMLKSIYSCNVSTLPKPMLLHPYALDWRSRVPALSGYAACSRGLTAPPPCERYLQPLCGRRFNEIRKGVSMSICKDVLWNNKRDKMPVHWRTYLSRYEVCVRQRSMPLLRCVPKLQEACDSSQLRVIKSVRATMDEVEPLLMNDPNFRVIHLYRDPRAVFRSRIQQGWSRSIYEMSRTPTARTAQVYCQTVLHDYKRRKELELKYPGRIKSIVYDKFMLDPERSRVEIHDFLNLASETRQTVTEQQRLSPQVKFSSHWQSEIDPVLVGEIENACQVFADTIGATWRNETS